tara:strand:- start:42 stop:626 length:585 start_codon:yes stop_codon:yes gene_type:complete
MAKRKAYAPFSLTSEAGVAQTPVEGYIDVEQKIYPTVNTGTINENGKWTGVKSDDTQFIGITIAEGIANGGELLAPDTNNFQSLDMTGFRDLLLAIKVSNAGAYATEAIFGPDTIPFANLTPVASGQPLRGLYDPRGSTFASKMVDSSEVLNSGVFYIFAIQNGRLAGQKNFQFKFTNNSGGASDMEIGFMRLV